MLARIEVSPKFIMCDRRVTTLKQLTAYQRMIKLIISFRYSKIFWMIVSKVKFFFLNGFGLPIENGKHLLYSGTGSSNKKARQP